MNPWNLLPVLLTHSLPSSVLRLVPLLGRPPEGNGMSVRRETEQREAIDDGRAHSRYALSSLTRFLVSLRSSRYLTRSTREPCGAKGEEEWERRGERWREASHTSFISPLRVSFMPSISWLAVSLRFTSHSAPTSFSGMGNEMWTEETK